MNLSTEKGKQELRIIFMGTPEFAIPSLDILVNAGYDIVGVITAPDRMGGRGRKQVIESDIKKYAREKGLNILQPANLKSPAFVETLRTLNADLQIVVAFRMLPEVVWDMPPKGTYNLHGSMLPKYRGAAPINWAIIKGENTTGVTSFKLRHEIDTGSVLLQEKIPIYPSDDAGKLHDRMKYIAADVVLETVRLIENDRADLSPQDDSKATKAPKLTRKNTEIRTDMAVQQALDFIRGLHPYPLAWTCLGDKTMKILKASPAGQIPDDPTKYRWISDNKSYLLMAMNDGYIRLEEIKYEGKRKMDIGTFLNGFDLSTIPSCKFDPKGS